ncbi:MAG: type II toxin-antitoxin system ParD family antitoxin [Thioalkalivibrio sp.]|jgi:antitoxin ParD1/3/4|nr:type II toxin-antitoxin system ParD family antitoxin [Thioalkalivibrio sp.]
MNVSLTPQLETLIRRKLDSGLYHSASEVIREALRLLEERDTLQAAKLERLRDDLGEGLDALDRGEGSLLDTESIKQQGRKARDGRSDA